MLYLYINWISLDGREHDDRVRGHAGNMLVLCRCTLNALGQVGPCLTQMWYRQQSSTQRLLFGKSHLELLESLKSKFEEVALGRAVKSVEYMMDSDS